MEGKAVEICVRTMELHNVLPEPRQCNHLLRLLVEHCRWVDVRKLYDEVLAEEGIMDNYNTCVMIRALCLEGRLEEGRNLIKARWKAGCVPQVVFYNVLIDTNAC
jgi:pentatricopeptide repeat protein